MKELYFHPKAPHEARVIYQHYSEISEQLGDEFWQELTDYLDYARTFPERHHYDSIGAGLRRCNLKRFPIHFLFRVLNDRIRVNVIRHDRRHPNYGIRRR